MRIAVIALDTRGGVQPYTALGLGLRAAGHEVTLLGPSDALAAASARGLPTVPLSAPGAQEVNRSGVASMNARDTRRLMRRHMQTSLGGTARQALDACADADVITGGIGGMTIGLPVAEKLRTPFVEAHLQPIGPPNGTIPGPMLTPPPAWLGPVGNHLSNVAARTVLQMTFAAPVRHLRREVLGLPRRPAVPPRADLPVLYGYSPVVLPKPRGWGASRHVTGYWPLLVDPDWSPPPELSAFLAVGPPPVCIGFGSMVVEDRAATTALVLEAVRRAGVRAVLLAGWGGLGEGQRSTADDVLVLDEAPHDWLYPRCAAAVHHGGAGTTGAALRAGVPAVVVPFGVDQPMWASRVVALGTGPQPIPRRRLTAERLTHALRAVADGRFTERAAAVGALIRAEDGIGAAVAHYDALGRSPHRRSATA